MICRADDKPDESNEAKGFDRVLINREECKNVRVLFLEPAIYFACPQDRLEHDTSRHGCRKEVAYFEAFYDSFWNSHAACSARVVPGYSAGWVQL